MFININAITGRLITLWIWGLNPKTGLIARESCIRKCQKYSSSICIHAGGVTREWQTFYVNYTAGLHSVESSYLSADSDGVSVLPGGASCHSEGSLQLLQKVTHTHTHQFTSGLTLIWEITASVSHLKCFLDFFFSIAIVHYFTESMHSNTHVLCGKRGRAAHFQ